ncbi:hypothetical protein P5M00_00405 [Enterobacter asburiae]|uniref:hypothetical protein n=1 Tax=Enterobacter asburiae TaxID=61645 RepID=UPI003855E79E
MMGRITKLMAWLLCVGAVACSGEKGASGQKVAVPEVQRAKAAVTHGKDREKTCSSQQPASERVVVENSALSKKDKLPVNIFDINQMTIALTTGQKQVFSCSSRRVAPHRHRIVAIAEPGRV